jgi:hypothetical protein
MNEKNVDKKKKHTKESIEPFRDETFHQQCPGFGIRRMRAKNGNGLF